MLETNIVSVVDRVDVEDTTTSAPVPLLQQMFVPFVVPGRAMDVHVLLEMTGQ
jgi:hypothetical protein